LLAFVFAAAADSGQPRVSILDAQAEAILTAVQPTHRELRKHLQAVWMFGALLGQELGLDAARLGELRVVCLGHDAGSVLGDQDEEKARRQLLEKARSIKLNYLGRRPSEVGG
jgi:HD-GYP domain-containing protein (c-di-GMP phosphodiesterase class II)